MENVKAQIPEHFSNSTSHSNSSEFRYDGSRAN